MSSARAELTQDRRGATFAVCHRSSVFFYARVGICIACGICIAAAPIVAVCVEMIGPAKRGPVLSQRTIRSRSDLLRGWMRARSARNLIGLTRAGGGTMVNRENIGQIYRSLQSGVPRAANY